MGYGRDGTAPNRSAGYGRQDEMVAPRSRRNGYGHAQAGLSRCRDPFRDGHHGDDALAYRARDYGRGSLGREAVAALGRNDDVGTFRSRGFGRDGYRREEAPAPPGSMAHGRVDHGRELMAPARSECYVREEMQPPMSRGADLHRAAAAAAREPAGASTAPVTGSESSPALGRVLSNKSMTVRARLSPPPATPARCTQRTTPPSSPHNPPLAPPIRQSPAFPRPLLIFRCRPIWMASRRSFDS